MNEVLTTSEMKINSAKTNILICTRDPKIKAGVYLTFLTHSIFNLRGAFW